LLPETRRRRTTIHAPVEPRQPDWRQDPDDERVGRRARNAFGAPVACKVFRPPETTWIGTVKSTQRDAGLGIRMKESRRALEHQFERILAEHGAAMARMASGYERVAGIRQELVQEIALAIWQALPHFRGECSERTFVFRIAHNRALTHVWRRRPPQASLEDLEEMDQPVDPRPHPDEQLAHNHQRARLLFAIQSLPVTHRQMMVLMLEGLSYAEIGEVLGITENNVAVRMTRARKALKAALGVNP
jgi:RNA polymerase sigma factor (sigma-70 family)